MSIAYYNGEFLDYSEIRIPLSDRAIFFGDGIYDAAIGKGGCIYLKDKHFDRFFSNAKRLNIPLGFTKEELSELICELIKRNEYDQYFIYFQLSRTSPTRIHSYPDSQSSNLLITLREHTLPSINERLRLISCEDTRYLMCDVKTLNLLPAVLASRRAVECGCDEAVFVRDGVVTECAHSNIFIVKDGLVLTHPCDRRILPGVTRARILEICKDLGIPCLEKSFGKNDLFTADEVLVSSTTRLCQTAYEIDGIEIEKAKNSISGAIISSIRRDFGA